MHDPLLFVAATLTILVMPGPTNTLVATSGATAGFRRSLQLIGGEVAGYLIAITLVGLVLKPLLVQAPLIFGILRTLAGAYMLLLAVGLWRFKPTSRTTPMLITLRQVFVTTLLNPKAIVFALGIIPFGSPDVPFYLAGFAGLVILAAVGWAVVGRVVGAAADQKGYAGLLPRLGAVIVALFAVILLLSPYV